MSTNKRIVSIVEDDPSNALFFQEALRGFTGISVLTFTDPYIALRHFQEFDYAYVLVISDLKLQGLDGFEFLKNVKDTNPFVRTILITAALRFDNKIFRKCIKKNIINGFIQKPICLHDFLKEVNSQLQLYETQIRHPSNQVLEV